MSAPGPVAAASAWRGTSAKIDQSTQDFLKMLEEKTGSNGPRKDALKQPIVKGGLPPHLLRQKQSETATVSASSDPVQPVNRATAGNSNTFGQYYGGSHPVYSLEQEERICTQELQSRPQERQSRFLKQSCFEQPPRFEQQPCNDHKPRDGHQSRDHHHSRDNHQPRDHQSSAQPYPQEEQSGAHIQSRDPRLMKLLRRTDPEIYHDREPLAPAYPAKRDTSEVARTPNDSRWAANAQNRQPTGRPQAKQIELAKNIQPATNGGFRLSAKPYDNWSPSPECRGAQDEVTRNEQVDTTETRGGPVHKRQQQVASNERVQATGSRGGPDHNNNNNNNDENNHHQQQQQQQTSTELMLMPEGKLWRPKHSWDLSSQDLPLSVKGSLHFDDDGAIIGNFDDEDSVAHPDIRGTVAGELDLVPRLNSQGFYNKNRWNEYPEDPEDPHDCKWRPTYCQQWSVDMEEYTWPVAKWLTISDMQHEECDVQPSNGWLMAPVEYPETHINPEHIIKATNDMRVRRNEYTANLKIKSDYEKIKRRIETRESDVLWEANSSAAQSVASVTPPYQADAGPDRRKMPTERRTQGVENASRPQPAARPTAQPTPPSTNAVARQPPTIIPGKVIWHPIYGQIYHEPKVIEHTDAPTYLKITCFMRPAEERDLPQVLAIYNWEVAHGMQALDTSALHLNNIKRIFKQCQQSKTPFIVMVAGRAPESDARKKVAQDQRQWGSQQRSVVAQDKVIGFSFVSIMDTGLDGDVHRNVDRFLGRVHIYVAKDSRRKGVGRALLQKTLVFGSRNAIIRQDKFVWHQPDRTDTYDDAFYNSRSYSRLFIKFASRGKDDPNQKWMTNFLDTENFICVSTMDMSRKIGYGDQGEIVDTIVCQHDCQNPQALKENDPNRT